MSPVRRIWLLIAAALVLLPVLLVAAAWGSFALYYHAGPLWIAAWLGALAAALVLGLRRGAWRGLTLAGVALAVLLGWWSTIRPSNDRDWALDVARTLTGQIDGSTVTLENVRNFQWRSSEDFTERWETRSYDLERLVSVDMILNYWMGPAIAHTLVSFGFEDGERIVFSVEIRKERGARYSPYAGFFRVYELSIVAANERDALLYRTNIKPQEVYIYRVAMSPGVMRDLFGAYVIRANEIAAKPRWYNTITANCTTIVYAMIVRIVPGLPLDWRLVFSGYLPEYVYELGHLDMRYDLDALRAMGYVTLRGQAAGDDPDYSSTIREGIPPL